MGPQLSFKLHSGWHGRRMYELIDVSELVSQSFQEWFWQTKAKRSGSGEDREVHELSGKASGIVSGNLFCL